MDHNESYEEFSESQLKILERYVTNTDRNIFALRNLPEVIKGALFSRYSRSTLGLRSLLLREFVLNEETAFSQIAGSFSTQDESQEEQVIAIKKAQNFYDRILDGYGDDSIGELGGAHLALENVSMLAAKLIEDSRIGGSPLEKSARYVFFGQKMNGSYLFYHEPILMASAFRDLYVDTCNHLFDTYTRMIPPLTEYMEARFPKEEETSKAAYATAIRTKVLDCLRGLLPASTLTNLGLFGNGRYFENLLQRMNSNNLAELQDIGKKGNDELSKVIPSFVRRGDASHKHFKEYADFVETMRGELKLMVEKYGTATKGLTEPGVRLVNADPDAAVKVAAALLFAGSDQGLYELQQKCRRLPEEELAQIFEAASNARSNRRHKSPRALEHANYTFEIIGDFGIYRDLHRHRMLTQERQLLSCDYGYFMPQEIVDTDLGRDYIAAMEQAREAYTKIAKELPEEAQYVVPMAYNIRWYFHVNLRALQWLCELRSQPQGHPNYRRLAQEMARQVCEHCPVFERFFKFVVYDECDLGRLSQEQRKEAKRQQGTGE